MAHNKPDAQTWQQPKVFVGLPQVRKLEGIGDVMLALGSMLEVPEGERIIPKLSGAQLSAMCYAMSDMVFEALDQAREPTP